MRTLLALFFAVAMAGYAFGSSQVGGVIGVFFDTDFEHADFEPAGAFVPFQLYLVLFNPTEPIITGLEFQMVGLPTAVYAVTSAQWKTSVNGTAPIIPVGDNFGGQVVWAPTSTGGCAVGEATILCTYNLLALSEPVPEDITLGPYSIPSIPEVPVYAAFDPNILYALHLTIGPDSTPPGGHGVVATLLGGTGGVVAAEQNTLSSVKDLFR